MTPFNGVQFTVVEAGTVVGKDPQGKEMIVTDSNAVMKGAKAWVTQKVYDAIKAKVPTLEAEE
jgi:hypothetical protein